MKSGQFMNVYLWIILILVLGSIVAGSVVSVICCCEGDADAKPDSEADKEVGQDKKKDGQLAQ